MALPGFSSPLGLILARLVPSWLLVAPPAHPLVPSPSRTRQNSPWLPWLLMARPGSPSNRLITLGPSLAHLGPSWLLLAPPAQLLAPSFSRTRQKSSWLPWLLMALPGFPLSSWAHPDPSWPSLTSLGFSCPPPWLQVPAVLARTRRGSSGSPWFCRASPLLLGSSWFILALPGSSWLLLPTTWLQVPAELARTRHGSCSCSLLLPLLAPGAATEDVPNRRARKQKT